MSKTKCAINALREPTLALMLSKVPNADSPMLYRRRPLLRMVLTSSDRELQ